MERIINEIRNNQMKHKLKSFQQNVQIFTQGNETGYQGNFQTGKKKLPLDCKKENKIQNVCTLKRSFGKKNPF